MKLFNIFGFLASGIMLFAALSSPSYADDTAKQKLFIELYEAMRYDRILDQITASIGKQAETALRKKYGDVDQKTLDTVREVIEESFSELKPGIVEFVGSFMVKNFSEEDIKNITAFYKTPTGQKSLTLIPKMTQEMTAWMVPNIRSMQSSMIEKLNQRLKSQGFNL